MKLGKDSLRIMTHDSHGGISGAAVFMVLYDLLQRVDDAFTSNNQIKKSMSKDDSEKINVFNAVNELRKDRAKMVNSYANYKLIFMCLNHYGKNKSSFDNIDNVDEIYVEYNL